MMNNHYAIAQSVVDELRRNGLIRPMHASQEEEVRLAASEAVETACIKIADRRSGRPAQRRSGRVVLLG